MQRRSGKKLRTRSPTLTALTVFFLTLISISLASLLFYSLMMNTARTEFKQIIVFFVCIPPSHRMIDVPFVEIH